MWCEMPGWGLAHSRYNSITLMVPLLGGAHGGELLGLSLPV